MSNEFDDLLDGIDGQVETPHEEKQNHPTGGYSRNKKKFDPFKDEITPKEVDVDSLMRFNRMFTVVTHGDVPDDTMNIIEAFCRKLIEKGFTYRYDGDARSKASLLAYTASKQRSEIFLPWKKFNTDVDATLAYPKEDAYRIGAFYHTKLNDLAGPVKGFIARNVHVLLGGELNTPLSLLICYTEDGSEVTKGMDYKKAGNASFFIRVCEDLDIPVFNMKQPDAKERLIEYIKSL